MKVEIVRVYHRSVPGDEVVADSARHSLQRRQRASTGTDVIPAHDSIPHLVSYQRHRVVSEIGHNDPALLVPADWLIMLIKNFKLVKEGKLMHPALLAFPRETAHFPRAVKIEDVRLESQFNHVPHALR